MKKSIKFNNTQYLIDNAKKYDVDYSFGLNDEQVAERVKDGLTNKTRKNVTKSYPEIIFSNLFNVFNVLLYIIAVFMGIAKLFSGMIFVLVLVLNIGIGLFQDIRARKVVDKLSLISDPKATVIRNGKETTIKVDEIVLSDVIILKSGNQIPTDGIIVSGDIMVNESFLSGESDQIVKHVGQNVYSGSFVVSGTAVVSVSKVGKANFAESIQEKARNFNRPKSEILSSFNFLFKIIGGIVILMAALEITTWCLGGNIFDYDYFVKAVSSISGSLVPMIPMGMYLLTSITLTVGVIILAKRRMIVHEMYCIEVLARVNVVCFDKTGTLTDGKMAVNELINFENTSTSDLKKIVSSIISGTKDENLTAEALKKEFGTIDLKDRLIETIPFNSDNKYSAISLKDEGTLIMGAFGFFPLKNSAIVTPIVKFREEQGERILVVATSKKEIKNGKIPNDLTAVGLIILSEHIRDDAIDNINWFKKNGVSIRVISGDSVTSVQKIAKDVGVEGAEKAISLEGMSLDEVKKIALDYNVFGRVNPEQKEVIITAIHDDGKIVAMTGDGVNDILALKKADCSIAMASGADAAKSISHIVSVDSNFSSLPKVVEEGRRVINNLQRTCSVYLIKTIFAILISLIFLIMSWVNPDVVYPFETKNLYIWELISIGLASFALALQPNVERLSGGFVSNLLIKAIPAGLIQVLIVVAMFLASGISPNQFPADSVAYMSVIAMTVMSFIYLLGISWPLDKYRSFVVIGATILGAGCFIADFIIYKSANNSILGINYDIINLSTLLLGLLIILIAIPIYFLSTVFFKKGAQRIIKRGLIK